jgi:hypothetical protein
MRMNPVLLKESAIEREAAGRAGYLDFWRKHGRSRDGILIVDFEVFARLKNHFAGGGSILAHPLVIPASIQTIMIPRAERYLSIRRTEAPKPVENHWRRVEGPRLWAELHHRPFLPGLDGFAETAWLNRFTGRVLCGECRNEWLAWVRENPVDLSSSFNYFRWTVDTHNAVNRRLGKPEMTVDEAFKLHRGGGR